MNLRRRRPIRPDWDDVNKLAVHVLELTAERDAYKHELGEANAIIIRQQAELDAADEVRDREWRVEIIAEQEKRKKAEERAEAAELLIQAVSNRWFIHYATEDGTDG